MPNERRGVSEPSGRIRVAQLNDTEAMRTIECAAGSLFAHIEMDDVAAHPPPEATVLTDYVRGGRAWIAEAEGRPVGYAIADVVDGCGHLFHAAIEQVSVHPAYGRMDWGAC
jgi:hypothetical protein